MKKLILVMALFVAAESYAGVQGPFTITCTTGCGGAGIAEALQKMENDINKDLPDADQSTYLSGMADASVGSQKGVGTDYINDIDVFIVGVGLGLGAHVGESTFSDLTSGNVDGKQLRGIGVAPSLLLGFNAGMFDLPEWEYFNPNKVKLTFNFFTYKENDDEFNAKMTNFGVHGRYNIVAPIAVFPAKLIHWHGVNLSTGFEYNSLELAYTRAQSETYTDSGAQATINGSITVGAKVNTMSVPIEASTGVTLGYIFSLYGGLGADISFGSAESIVALPVTIDGTVPNNFSAKGALDLGSKDSPSTFLPRGFVGIGLGVPLVKLNVQLDKGFGEGVYAATAALRVTW